ncbi:MAG: HAMP domain-containing protein [Anaerolineaceae bacterium]|nr:MAG: HAMP domain-containing protein [Anaerolineaceae bacterium]
MFWKSARSFSRTTTFRLTLWYLGVFSALSVAVFLVVYVTLALRLQAQTDNELLDKSKEFETLYREHGIKALQAEFAREAESQGTGRVLFQLLSSSGIPLASSGLSKWKELDITRPKEPSAQKNQPFYSTISLHRQRHKIRLLSMPINGGEWIDVGSSLQREELILERYRETFGVALMVMVGCGGLFGFLLARKAMAGVQRVTDTATGIGRNDLGRRVPLTDQGEEINALARAFNAMLERIEILLGEFRQVTDNVAHELRTPITRIRGMAETTLKGEEDLCEYKEMAASVIDGCDDLIEMIGTMLEIAKTDSGAVELDLVPLDLLDLVEEAADLFTPMAEDKDVVIRLSKPAKTATVIGDRRRLQRVVSNLLDNAVKYTPGGGVITVSIEIEAGNIKVAIADTGIGINDSDIPHIFERFYRCDKSRSTSGSGLGLSLALAIIHAHGGDITVQSSEQGSTFSFFLPVSSSQVHS